ncbi:MAG: queuosine precursor transporter [Candidatus Woesearchaeota archaeon]|jgi:hypothetical protein
MPVSSSKMPEITEQLIENRSYKYLDYITGLFVAILLISNTASVKILNLGWFTFDGGTILFPLAYIFGDILTEVYGYKRSRRVIWTGFFCIILMAVVYAIVGYLPAAADWGMQDAYMSILGIVPRIVLASIIAYFAREFSNSYILAKMKVWMQGKHLWMRTIGSTIVGEGVDTSLFVLIAFAGTMPTSLLVAIIVSNYIFKVSVEVLFTPVTYAIVNFLKKKENEDYYDTNTNFNPLDI